MAKNQLIKKIVAFLFIFSILFGVFSYKGVVYAEKDNTVYLCGLPACFSVEQKGCRVLGFCSVLGDKESVSPAKEAGLIKGDVILYIGNYEINGISDIEKAISNGKEVEITYKRGANLFKTKITPKKDNFGKYKLGLFIQNNVSGIGTLTFIKNNCFASLGHPIVDNYGDILSISGGNLYNCQITGAIKGERGKAGELKGICINKNPLAKILDNNESGVFGYIDDKEIEKLNLQKVETGEAVIGNATLYSTVYGETPKYYDISIVKVDKKERGNKNLVLKINDKALLDITGGIVQGMSGSPILQNGKIVGALTHVFLNDSKRGFGICIENMKMQENIK